MELGQSNKLLVTETTFKQIIKWAQSKLYFADENVSVWYFVNLGLLEWRFSVKHLMQYKLLTVVKHRFTQYIIVNSTILSSWQPDW